MAPLDAILNRLADDELSAIVAQTYAIPPLGPPGLLAWIESCADVEQHRRRGIDLPLHPPADAIPPEEEVAALAATIALWNAAESDGLRSLFAAMVKLLTGERGH